MKVLGVDWGASRIGLAVSDDTGTLASPFKVVDNDEGAVNAVVNAASVTGAEEIVVGYPLTLRGEEGPAAERVQEFAEELQRRVGVPIKLIDERFTTKAAEEKLRAAGASPHKIKKTADAAAAALILQTYLDVTKKGLPAEPPP
ncbi:MAG: Holliday junction resolvase RuvX [Candidatus Coatesbacteria bacterium]|nr:MAG: Holliday junction resolvase RuvX [Candidatus Coatesbacteria bacterium]